MREGKRKAGIKEKREKGTDKESRWLFSLNISARCARADGKRQSKGEEARKGREKESKENQIREAKGKRRGKWQKAKEGRDGEKDRRNREKRRKNWREG